MRPWDSLSADEQRLFSRMAEVYAGYISYTDHELGRVLDYLEESEQLDNTLIVVVSDNGGSGEGGPNGSFNEWRFFNGIADSTELTIPHIDELGTPASYNHYTPAGPGHSTRRFRTGSAGPATRAGSPTCASSPGRRRSRPRRSRAASTSTPSTSSRRSTSCSGIEPPEVIKGYPQSPIEGESFAASLTDAEAPAKETQFYAMLGQRSIYHQGWLACTLHPPLSGWGKFDQDVWELYNLEEDRAQSNNLAEQEPVRLEELKEPLVLLRRDLQRAAAR